MGLAHPTDKKKIIAASKQLYYEQQKHGKEILETGMSRAKKDLEIAEKSNKLHYGQQTYDTEYHFYVRTVDSGKYLNTIKEMESSVAKAKHKLDVSQTHIEYWSKVVDIYKKKAAIEQKTYEQRKQNLEAYKAKCERIRDKYKNCGGGKKNGKEA